MIANTFQRLAAGLLLCTAASAHAFPEKTITVLMPFAPGTSTDVIAREFGQVLSTGAKQPVVVDNKVGAEGRFRSLARRVNVIAGPGDR